MKIRIEIEEGACEEVVIRAPSLTDEVRALAAMISRLPGGTGELALRRNERECYVACADILFFEVSGGCTVAHTADSMYTTPSRLYELEEILPHTFVRASKSCLVNTAAVCEISHRLTGGSEVFFRGSHKQVFVSRMYDKAFRDKIMQTRLQQ